MRLLVNALQRSRMLLSSCLVLAAIATPALTAAPAQAEYYWGCTYTYNNACLALPEGATINRLWTTYPQAAIGLNGYAHPANGYKVPVLNEHESIRYVCGGATWAGAWTIPVSCGWGYNFYNLEEFHWGQARIWSPEHYNQIALYQNVNIYE